MRIIWKDILGYEGIYQVSNTGMVKSLNYSNTKKPRILKQSLTYDGYPKILLSKDGKRTNYDVHVLVARAFVPNPLNKPQVNHIDGNKLNNHSSNLEWCTPIENTRHAIANGLRSTSARSYKRNGEHYASKPILQYSLDGDFIKLWDCYSEAARFYNCDPCSLVNCTKGRIQTVRGFIWRPYDGNGIVKNIQVQHIRNRKSIERKYS